ncbi:hypothetical protein M4951_12510 [Blastopirellula sp. J2-11]|uniref:hypothetical protein n=1 Tax=Blastopirellula sp. J2-11 TaxID=2943192 RepID=UPI0021C91E6C|nr:hypothetical protein [Blastopirellula sp. J2-11]UUO09105.1 hypothetical protein M4951_12510 [Blastopirellula sp. J2-11]
MIQLSKITFVLIAIGAVGCSDPGPARFPAQGILTLDGKPLPFKSITFYPVDGTDGQGASGNTDAEGKFNLLTIVPGAVRDYRGCQPGRYHVIVQEPMFPIHAANSEGSLPLESIQGESIEGIGPPAAISMIQPVRRKAAKERIPAVYRSETTSPLIVEVGEGMEPYKLDLGSKS